MTWVKLDDRFPDNPKVAGLSDSAAWLYVRGLCYCATHLTDGVLPAGVIANVLRAKPRHVSELTQAGLWHVLQTGSVVVHDYLEYNPTRAKVEAQRKATAERVVKHRRGRDEGGGSSGGAHGDGSVGGAHDPDGNATVTPLQPRCSNVTVTPPPSRPVPSPDQDPPLVPPVGGKRAARVVKRRSRRAPAAWEPSPEAFELARKLGLAMAVELAKFQDHEFATPRSDWDATFRNWLRTAAERQQRAPPGKAPGATEHEAREARRIEANTAHAHREWLKSAALDGTFGERAQREAQAGTLDLEKLEAWYERERERKQARNEGGSRGPTPIGGLLAAAVGGRETRAR